MMSFEELMSQPWVYGPLASCAAVLALLFLKRRTFHLIQKLAARTATRMDDLLLEAAGRPLNVFIVASGLMLLGRILPLTEEADVIIGLLYKVIVIASLIWFVDRLARGLVEMYATRVAFIGQARVMIQGIVRGLIAGVGCLILLDSMGISITPLLASLGVGSLAVALALQGTLANLFAGLHLVADNAIETGQFIKIESGQEGTVEKIGWRSTRIRMRSNVTLIVPNQKLVESVITNYELPAPETAVTVTASVHYDSDLAAVERVTLDVASSVLREVTGGVREFKPVFRFTSLADSGITFDVILSVKGYGDAPDIRHEFIKRLRERFRAEGIVMPYPTRTVDLPDRVLDRMGPGASPPPR